MKNINNVLQLITVLDWIIFFLILLLTFSFVFYGQSLKSGKGKNKTLEYLLMGRRLTLPMFIATLVATWYGGIFGVTKIAFEKGIYNFITQGVFWYIAYLIFAFFLADKLRSTNALTLPDLVNKMFGPKSSIIAALFNFFNVLPIAYSISVGLFIKLLFNIPFDLSMAIGLTIVVIYSISGGFRAVVFSDIIQFFVMCFSVIIVLFFSIYKFGGLNYLTSNLPKSYFTLTGGESLASTFVWGFIALSTLVDPNFYQRCFAAKDNKVAKKGIIIATFVWLLFDICTTFGAMYAKASMPELNSGTAYVIYAIKILPDGFRGFFLAGILATIISTLDSYLFLAGTTLSFDLMPNKYKGNMLLSHLGIIIVAIVSYFMAIKFDGNIKLVWKTLGSYSAACLLFPVLFGYIFPKKIKDLQFVSIVFVGVIFTSYWKLSKHVGIYANIDELYIGVLATGLSIGAFILSNSFTQRYKKKYNL